MTVAQEISALGNPKIDVPEVARQVLASEPLHAKDVESHIKWCKVWGGGLSQKITRGVCSYIKMCDCEIHHVSPAFFDELTKLKINPAKIPTRFVAGIIKCVATRSKDVR